MLKIRIYNVDKVIAETELKAQQIENLLNELHELKFKKADECVIDLNKPEEKTDAV